MKQLLKFDEMESSGKTGRFKVFNNHSGESLGIIHWLNSWRCYVMEYSTGMGNISMSLSCSKELDKFMEELENNHSSQTKPLKSHKSGTTNFDAKPCGEVSRVKDKTVDTQSPVKSRCMPSTQEKFVNGLDTNNHNYKGGAKMTEQQTTANWLEVEAENLNTGFTGEKLPSFKLAKENEIEEIDIDFSKEWGKYTQKNDKGKSVIKAIIPVTSKGIKCIWWLNKANPIYALIIKAGKAGQTKFKVMRTGNFADTKYVLAK